MKGGQKQEYGREIKDYGSCLVVVVVMVIV